MKESEIMIHGSGKSGWKPQVTESNTTRRQAEHCASGKPSRGVIIYYSAYGGQE